MNTSVDHLLSVISSQIEGSSEPSIASSGLLWYHFTRYQAQPNPEYVSQILQQWQAILERTVTEKRATSALIITETLQTQGWVTSELASKVQAYDAQLLNDTLDWLADPLWENLYRSAEVGYYLAHQSKKDSLIKWIDMFIVQANPDHYFDSYVQRDPVFLLGVEGLTGVLLMLETVARSSQQDALYQILRNGVSHLLSFRQEVDFSARQYAVFPRLANVAHQTSLWSGLLGWSGSDLTQALLLYRIAALLEDTSLRKTADLIGLNTLLRQKQPETTTDSANFHHGAAGIAQCYRALYEASGLEAYQQGYAYWIEQIKQHLSAEDKPSYEAHDLLHGLVGIALVLLSYQHSESLDWERVVLL